MAGTLDAYVNAYLLDDGFTWKPVRRVEETPLEAGGLGIQRVKWQAARYEGTLPLHFPTQTAYESLRTFWSAALGTSFTWDNPDDGVSYLCRFVGGELPFERVGADGWMVDLKLRGVPA